MPSATGQNWEKYNKTFADDEEPEKKIQPLSDECVASRFLGSVADGPGTSRCSRLTEPRRTLRR